MNFIATLIIVYFAFRLISYVVVRFLAYKVKKSGMSETGDAEDASSKSKKKIFNKDEGDYVDFEEVDKK